MSVPDASTSNPSSEVSGRIFIVVCSLAITTAVIATAGMLLAAAAFATARTFVIPFVATFEGFRDAGGTNAVIITGSWLMASALTIVLASVLSFRVIRRFGSSADSIRRA